MIDGFNNKDFSPVEITHDYLKRIEEFNELNAFITVTGEIALKQAAIAEKKYLAGVQTGILEGVPIAYKDNLYTKEFAQRVALKLKRILYLMLMLGLSRNSNVKEPST